MHTRTQQRRTWRKALTAAVVTGLLLGTAACTSEGTSADQGDGNNAELTVAVNAAPPSFDTGSLDLGQASYVWASVYDTLLYQDLEGQLQPNAAESWEYSDDALTLTLTLREGMSFSSGDPVNAAAVKATLEHTKSSTGVRSGDVTNIESVEAPDDKTVIINLSEPTPSLLGSLASGVGVIGDPATIDDERTALNPVGSGPYSLDIDATVSGDTYVLERRDDYWNADAFPFAKFTVRVIPDSQASYNALQAGEIDAATVRGDQIPVVEAAGFKTKPITALSIATLGFLDREGEVLPALEDVRVRQAIEMAVDRTKYVEQLLRGAGKATTQIFSPTSDVFDQDLTDLYPYDVERARELMAEAGYADGFEITMPSTFLTKTFEPTLTQSLAEIGITVTWTPVPAQDIARTTTTEEWPIVFFVGSLGTPAKDLFDHFGEGGAMNPFGTQDEGLLKLMDEVAPITDIGEADAKYREINTYIVDNALTAPLFYIGTTYATKPGIEFLPDGPVRPSVRSFGVTE